MLQSVSNTMSRTGIRSSGVILRCKSENASAAPVSRQETRLDGDIDRKTILPRMGQVPKRIWTAMRARCGATP
jgi:hypothetical protein